METMLNGVHDQQILNLDNALSHSLARGGSESSSRDCFYPSSGILMNFYLWIEYSMKVNDHYSTVDQW